MLKAPESFFFFSLSLKGHSPCLLLELVFSAFQTERQVTAYIQDLSG